MENQVTMSLEDYTKLIEENTKFKLALSGFKRKARNSIEDRINRSQIDKLTQAQAQYYISLLHAPDKDNIQKVLNDLTNSYSWTWGEIAEESYIMSTAEVKEMAVDIIHTLVKDRFDELVIESTKRQAESTEETESTEKAEE